MNYETASSKVIAHIQSEILHGRLRKGDKLPTERKLSEDMEISRASVREAIRALESMGIVTSIQGSGNYITNAPETAIDMALCALFALNDGTLNNIMQLRVMLEFEACKDIVAYATDEEIARIVRAADYDYENPSIQYQAEHDRNFHGAIIHGSSNPLIQYLSHTLAALFDVYREKVFATTLDRNENNITKRDHEAIVKAITDRDVLEIHTALANHMYLNKDYLEILDTQYRNILA